jgi:hypothetical protein
MKAFLISRMLDGNPDFSGMPYAGAVLCAKTPNNWGIYIITGTADQLLAINALSQVYGICTVTSPVNQPNWPELDDVIPAARRTRINEWLTDRGYPTVPAGWTYRHLILTACHWLNPNYEIENTDVLDP